MYIFSIFIHFCVENNYMSLVLFFFLNVSSTNAHLKEVVMGLVTFFSLNLLSRQKRMMRFSISKLHSINTRRYTAQITELNDYLDIFPGSDNFNNMIESYLNNII